MIDSLITGKLIRDPALKTGASGKPYCNFLLSVPTGDAEPVIVSGIAFADVAERIGRLNKGDALSVAGSLKPSEWSDKTTGLQRVFGLKRSDRLLRIEQRLIVNLEFRMSKNATRPGLRRLKNGK
jgi:single-stranded DNA-binding protein